MVDPRYKALLVKLILDAQQCIETARVELKFLQSVRREPDDENKATDEISFQKNFIEKSMKRLEM